MNRAIDAYLAELAARRFSHSRRHHAARTLERLLLYMREAHSITDWRAVNESQLRDFALYAGTRHRSRTGQRISAATLRQWLSIMRSFFTCLNRNGHLLHNPAERLAFPRPEQSLPHVLNESEIARLIESPCITTAIGLRDRALLETLYASGIRHAEAHRLDLYDVDTAAQRLTVRLGKGQRDRIVPLTETAAHWLTRYLTVARSELAAGLWWGKGRRRNAGAHADQGKAYHGDEGKNSLEAKYGPGFSRATQQKPLLAQSPPDTQSLPGPAWIASTPAFWLSVTGRRLSYQMIAERIRDYALQAKVKASVHTFRHSCATHLLRGGASIRHVQQLLGHRDLNTTEIYAHIELQDLQQAVESAANKP
ncbi:MAG TPA: tyrosine-type recombinase/integrase [Candidatus Limnocylindria bacterium]|nr:tyrosine-type recombinase/integrase [Candidatus Limnocylindria bacterium]